MKTGKTIPISEYVFLQTEIQRLQSKIDDLELNLRAARRKIQFSQLEKSVSIWCNGINRMIKIKDIAMIKAESNYSVIFLISGERIFTAHTLKYWNDKINSPFLIRVHKSYLVNNRNINSFDKKAKNIYLQGGNQAKYSRNYAGLLQFNF